MVYVSNSNIIKVLNNSSFIVSVDKMELFDRYGAEAVLRDPVPYVTEMMVETIKTDAISWDTSEMNGDLMDQLTDYDPDLLLCFSFLFENMKELNHYKLCHNKEYCEFIEHRMDNIRRLAAKI